MTATANDVVRWMASQVGVQENPLGSNNVKYNTEYYGRAVSGGNYAWCQAMIWVCFKDLNILNLYGAKSAYTVFVAGAFNQQGRFYKWNTTPQPGDMIFYDWNGGKSISGIDHVGIVESVNSDGTINTYEGNVSNKVVHMRRQRTYVVGFARPAYGSSSSSTVTPTTPSAAGSTYKVVAGDSLWAISKKHGITVNSLKSANNLTSDIIYVGQQLTIPGESDNSTSAISYMGIAGVQKWANTYSFNNIAVDGISGPATKAALVKIIQSELNTQYSAGLIVDGVFGSATRNAWDTLYPGAQGNLTRAYQGLLICLGYDTNGFDGIYGPSTVSATKQLQSARGISADGIAGKDTISVAVR